MAVNDRSLGPLYLARTPTPHRWHRSFEVGIVQLIKPWRQGQARALPSGPFRHALVIGWWTKMPKDEYRDWLGDEQWLRGRKLATVAPHDISTWDRGPDEPEAEEEEAIFVSEPFAPDGESAAPGPQ